MRPEVQEKVAGYEGYSGAIHLANKPMDSARPKHIDNRHHFVCDVLRQGDTRIVHVDS